MKQQEKKRVIGLIPARLGAHRFPDKLIKEIDGKSILQLVYEQCLKCSLFDEVLVVTGDVQVADLARTFNAQTLLSQAYHRCGTDRCIEVAKTLGAFDIAVNVQADQPFINPDIIDDLIKAMLKQPQVKIGSLMSQDISEQTSSSTVKVMVDSEGIATDFTRELHDERVSFEHIGVYAFRNNIIDIIDRMTPSNNEIERSLEQLRWMDHGLNIQMFHVNDVPISINVPADLERLKGGR